MTALKYDTSLRQDVERITAHLNESEVQDIRERLAQIFDALWLLTQHPLIGRPTDMVGCRELVIGEGARGYVALYSYDALNDSVEILALCGQRESGFRDR